MNVLPLPLEKFTYLSTVHNSTTWLDHVISIKNMIFSQIRVSYDWSSFARLPITAGLEISSESLPLPVQNESSTSATMCAEWGTS